MLHDRVQDITSAQTAAIQYVLQGVSRSTVQSCLSSLKKLCGKDTSFSRYCLKCAVGNYVSAPSEERALLASKLILSALEQPNAYTLLSAALDAAPTLNEEQFAKLLVTDLKLTPPQQMQTAIALSLSTHATVKSSAGRFLESLNLPAISKDEDAAVVRGSALLVRHLGTQEDLDAQLTAQCGSTVLFPSQGERATNGPSLAGVLRELGTGCCTTVADSRSLLSIFPNPFTERDVAEVLGFFASQGTAANDLAAYMSVMNASGQTPSKNAGGNMTMVIAMPLVDALNSTGTFNWDTVIRLLDQPHEDPFKIKHISVIFDAYHKFTYENVPITFFLGRWVNARRQKVALEYILKHPDKVNRKSLTLDAPAELLPSTKPANISTVELELWRCYAFVETAVQLGSRDKDFDNDVLRPAAERLPLLFLHTLFLGTFTGTIKNFVLIKYILQSHCPSLDLVAEHIIPEAEKRGKLDSVISLFSELTITNPGKTVEVLEMVLKCKSTIKPFLKGSGSPRLVVAIAMCMEEAGEPSDNWIQRALDGKLHLRGSATENRFSVAMNIVEVAEMLLEKQLYTTSTTAALNALVASPLKNMLSNVMDCAKSLLAASNSLFPEDVEKEAMAILKAMYDGESVANTLKLITNLKKSSSARDKQLYACVINIMFDENPTISTYPIRALRVFAELYGQLIAQELLSPAQQQRAWGQLLPAIAKPNNTLIEEYGVIALEQIKPRIAEWPQYGRALRHVKDLDFKVPGIMAAINRGIKAEEKNNAEEAKVASPTTDKDGVGALPVMDPAVVAATKAPAKGSAGDTGLHTMDIGTLISNRVITSPPKVIQEQINFLIGNTDNHNLETNARELSQLLRSEYYEYFAEYLVVKRAALEPNYHSLYIELLAKVGAPELDRSIRTSTIAAVHRLLSSDKIRTDQNERKLLKNLATWFGSITLKKNIPILYSDLNFRELVYLGIREGKLTGVLSFICAVVACSAESVFFAIPNPWTLSQLWLLLDVYTLPNLKTTLHFEVELLCEALDVTLQGIHQLRLSSPYYSTTREEMLAVLNSVDIKNSPDFVPGSKNTNQQIAALLSTTPITSSPPPLASARPLQATAQPFQPGKGSASPDPHAANMASKLMSAQPEQQKMPMIGPGGMVAAGPQGVARPAGPGIANEFPRKFGNKDIPRRPEVGITPANVRVAPDIEKMLENDIARVAFRERLAAELEVAARTLFELYGGKRSSFIASSTTFSLIAKDFADIDDFDSMRVAGEGMARSLASNLCFATVKLFIKEEIGRAVERLTPVTPFLSTATLELKNSTAATVAATNAELVLRRLEFLCGEMAWMQLSLRLREEQEYRSRTGQSTVPVDRNTIQRVLGHAGPDFYPTTQLKNHHKDAYADFYFALPIINIFNSAVRAVEEQTPRCVQDKATGKEIELHLKTLNDEETTRVLQQRIQNVITIITPESSFNFVQPIFTKLMSVEENLQRLYDERTRQQQEQAAAKAEEGAAAAATSTPEMSPERKNNERLIGVYNFLIEFYIHIIQHCASCGGESVVNEFTRLYLRSENPFASQRKATMQIITNLLAVRAISFKMFDSALSSVVHNHIRFASELIDTGIRNLKIFTSADFSQTLQVLNNIALEKKFIRHITVAPPTVAIAHTSPICENVGPKVTKLIIPALERESGEEFNATVVELLDQWVDKWLKKGQRGSGERTNPSVEFVRTLQEKKMLESKNLLLFLGISIRLCVEHYANVYLQLEREYEAGLSNHELMSSRPAGPVPYRVPYDARLFVKCDAFTELSVVLLRCCGLRYDKNDKNSAQSETAGKQAEVTLLKRLLEMLKSVFIKHYDATVSKNLPSDKVLPEDTAYIPVFQQQPYVRIISNLLITFERQDASTGAARGEHTNDITNIILELLHRLPPCKFPAFAFGWLELVSHRLLIRRCERPKQLWQPYIQLLIDAFEFIELISPNNAISGNGVLFSKSVFKLMLILLHDSPVIFCTYYFPLCNAIPPYCVQMMNCVLSSFPVDLNVVQPFKEFSMDDPIMMMPVSDETLKVQHAVVDNVLNNAARDRFHVPSLLEKYIKSDATPIPESVMKEVLERLTAAPTRSLLNVVVLYVALTYLETNKGDKFPRNMQSSNAFALYQYLCLHFDTKMRYLFLVSCSIHMRFHNIQANFFAQLFFYLFLPHPNVPSKVQIVIQEQITRVLMEKTIVNQPHPWGQLNTFVTLLANPKFNFWEKSFVRAPHLEATFTRLRQTVETRMNASEPQQQ